MSAIVSRLDRPAPGAPVRAISVAWLVAALAGASASALAQETVIVGGSGLPPVEVNLDVLGEFDRPAAVLNRPPLPGAVAPSAPVKLHPPTPGGRVVLKPPSGVPKLRMPASPTERVQSAPILKPPKLAVTQRPPAPRPTAPAATAQPRGPAAPRAFTRSVVPEIIVVPPAPRRTTPTAGKAPRAPSRAEPPAPPAPAKVARLPPPPKAPPPPPKAPARTAKLPPPPKAPSPPPKTPTREAKAPPPPKALPPPPKAPARVVAPPAAPVPKARPKTTGPAVAARSATAPAAPKGFAPVKPAPPKARPPAAAPPPARKPAIETAKLAPPAAVAPRVERPGTGPLLSLRFGDGSARLSGDAERQLTRLASQLTETDSRLQLKAYASASGGTASAARRLSLSRALSVRSYLIEKGVRSTRIDVRALGLADDGGPEDRVDVLLLGR